MSRAGRRRKGLLSLHRGQKTLDLETAAALALPAKFPKGAMHTLFVGVSPAPKSAATNHFFAAPANMFWKMMFHAGLWPELKGPTADDDMVAAGFGFLDLSPRAASQSANLHPSDFSGAKLRLKTVCQERKPRTVAFVGKKAAEIASGLKSRGLAYGPQTFRLGASAPYLLPSTGGQSIMNMEYKDRLRHYRDFATFIQPYWRPPPAPPSPADPAQVKAGPK